MGMGLNFLYRGAVQPWSHLKALQVKEYMHSAVACF